MKCKKSGENREQSLQKNILKPNLERISSHVSINETLKNLHFERMKRLQEKSSTFILDGKHICINERIGEEIGTQLWGGSLSLCHALGDLRKEKICGMKTIELGAGVGLAGIYAAICGAHVTLTDRHSVIDLLARNAKKKCFVVCHKTSCSPIAVGFGCFRFFTSLPTCIRS